MWLCETLSSIQSGDTCIEGCNKPASFRYTSPLNCPVWYILLFPLQQVEQWNR
jgi:hypothetical protein